MFIKQISGNKGIRKGRNRKDHEGKELYNKQEQILNAYKQWIKIDQASLL